MDDHPVTEARTGAGAVVAQLRAGAYYDSVVLMLLQRSLAQLPGVLDAGVAMGTPANKDLLSRSALLAAETRSASPQDLILVVRARTQRQGREALDKVDRLLADRRSQPEGAYRPKTVSAAARMLPAAAWVIVSVPGRYAAATARDALNLGKNVLLYSDNVSLEEENSLKRLASARELLVMGPDCGTARVDGAGLGFANRVRRGNIGVVAASGTGLQAVMVGVHRLGGGISQAYGTGGRDLSPRIGGATAKQALSLLRRDAQTDVIVVVSKPPAEEVARELLAHLSSCGKPVVVNFIGFDPAGAENGTGPDLHFARTLDEAAEIAIALSAASDRAAAGRRPVPSRPAAERLMRTPPPAPDARLRALYSGGTLASEALLLLRDRLSHLRSNVPLHGDARMVDALASRGHCVVDLGGDEFTLGRLHPMLDNDLRVRRLLQEARDPETGLILLDVVLGDGAHPNPAGELGPAIEEAMAIARRAGRRLPVVAAVVGTALDPQGLNGQIERLEGAGACVFTRHDHAVQAVASYFDGGRGGSPVASTGQPAGPGRPAAQTPPSTDFAAINVGLEAFAQSLRAQGAEVVQVDWRPPAGGDDRLAGLLKRLR